uniref:BAHD-type acyltransferase n=1 Tax=Actaea racemosa TaxID=64040 RepID=D4NUX1_ACTRA|nr:BAHD-type acyltransferase [Actaea racemosa]
MEVVVSSREIIKPSSPTPNHLKKLNFSLNDQYSTHYVSVLLFYSAQGDVDRFKQTNTSDRLKKSLSEILTQFYPLAGRIINNECIDCNDDGLEYLEARVPCPLSQLLGCPKADELNQLIPFSQKLSAVQVSLFDCGGIAIGVTISHTAGDASSLTAFINSWAATAKGANEIVPPKFGFDYLFPPRDVPTVSFGGGAVDYTQLPRFVGKRFIFDSSKLAALKSACADVERPTRVEVVTAFIYKCFLNTIRSRSSKPSVLSMPINLRGRMNPPLPPHSFGNLAIRLTSQPWPAEKEPELNCLVKQLRETIRKVNGGFVEKLQADNAELLFEHWKDWKKGIELSLTGDLNVLMVLICCRFPFYEADFGWGKPAWATRVNLYPSVSLVDTKDGEGVEAWVTLAEGDMTRFCSEPDLLDFSIENPPIHE